jgi:hypothetical protein
VTINRTAITQFPEVVVEDKDAFAIVKRFLAYRKGSLYQRGVRYLNQLLSNFNTVKQ